QAEPSLGGQGSSHQALSGSALTDEQDALRRPDASLLEKLRALARELDGRLKEVANVSQTADLAPAGVRTLDHQLPSGRRLDASKCAQEVSQVDAGTLGQQTRICRVEAGQIEHLMKRQH